MSRRERIYGPYRERRAGGAERWRVVRSPARGAPLVKFFVGDDAEKEASRWAAAARLELPGAVTVKTALADYEQHLRDKGNKPSSRVNTMRRLRLWFPDGARPLDEIQHEEVAAIYRRRVGEVSVDTHRNELAEVKTWLGWCVGKRWLQESPAARVEGTGRRRRGKRQLRRGEAERFLDHCLTVYQRHARGWEAALGELVALLLGLRSGEVTGLRVRDVDDSSSGMLVWIDDSKTEAGRRYLEVPDVLARPLRAQVAHAGGGEWLFPARKSDKGHRTRTWLLRAARRLADGAGVARVPPHGLRGTGATLAREGGATGHAVAAQLGHSSERVQEAAYLAPGALERARVRWGAARVGGEK